MRQNLNIFDIPSMGITDEVPIEKVLEYVESAIENGSLATHLLSWESP